VSAHRDSCCLVRKTNKVFKRKVFSDQSEGGPPVSIPTTVVKPLSADGTALVAAWESRSLLNVTPGQAQLGPSDHCAFFVDGLC
jgi:hypothetical protein